MIEDIDRRRKKKKLNLDDEDNQKMGEIFLKDNKYYFIPNKKENMNELTGEELFAWLIFKGTKYPINKNRYRLKEGDILKLGRLWLIVRGIHLPSKKGKDKRLDIKDTDCIMVSHHNQGNQSLNIKDDFKDDNKMNVKYLDNSDDDSSDSEKKEKNKIINLIDDDKDKNTINNIKGKEKEKKEKKNNIQKICRICYLEEDNPSLNPKEVFPNYIKHNNKLYNLMDFEQNFGEDINDDKNNNNNSVLEGEADKKKRANGKKGLENSNNKNDALKNNKTEEENSQDKMNSKNDAYIILDSLSFEKNSPSYRYIGKFTKNELKIGRGIDMDLIMNDLSISRNHCHLELTNSGEVLLKDVNSKFGTLILVQSKKLEILEHQTLTIQVGRTFFHIGYKKNSSLFSCCQAEEIDMTQSYEKINYRAVKFNKFCSILTERESVDEEIQNEVKDEVIKSEKESEYDIAIKDINNKKNNNIEKSERLKTNVDKCEADLIDASKVDVDEKNNTFQQEKEEYDF